MSSVVTRIAQTGLTAEDIGKMTQSQQASVAQTTRNLKEQLHLAKSSKHGVRLASARNTHLHEDTITWLMEHGGIRVQDELRRNKSIDPNTRGLITERELTFMEESIIRNTAALRKLRRTDDLKVLLRLTKTLKEG